MSGLGACRQIRATSDITIVMLTIRGSEQDKVQALDAGSDDYVTKPFNTPSYWRAFAPRCAVCLLRQAGHLKFFIRNTAVDRLRWSMELIGLPSWRGPPACCLGYACVRGRIEPRFCSTIG